MNQDQKEAYGHFNVLFNRILKEHKTKRELSVVAIDLCKELRRVASAFEEDRVCKSSYQVLKLYIGGYTKTKRYIQIRSRLGFTVQVNHSNIEVFKAWAFSDDSNKVLPAVKRVNFGGNDIYTVKDDRTTNPELERLNIRHGIN